MVPPGSCKWPVTAHLARCRTTWRRSLHNPICRPSPWCIAGRDLRPGEPPEGQLDRGEGNEGGQGFGEVLEVLGETPIAAETGKGALDHPAARQDDEALRVVAPLDDLHAQQRHLCHRSVNLPRAAAAIGPVSVRAKGSACVFCRGRARPHRGPGSRSSGRRRASAALHCRPGAWILRPFTCFPAS